MGKKAPAMHILLGLEQDPFYRAAYRYKAKFGEVPALVHMMPKDRRLTILLNEAISRGEALTEEEIEDRIGSGSLSSDGETEGT